MAITLADFNKIWASTSPLTPYSFSESNYKQGWNFIGSTPPARQMWDFLQKQNDEKMQYIVNDICVPTEIDETSASGNYYSYPVPTGKVFANFKTLGGKTVAWNQLVQNGNFASIGDWFVNVGSESISVSDNILTFKAEAASNNGDNFQGNVLGTTQGHKYYVSAELKYNNHLPSTGVYVGSGGYDGSTLSWTYGLNVWGRLSGIFTRDTGGSDRIAIFPRPSGWSVGDTCNVRNVWCVDLTLMFGAGNEPTLAEFEAMFPASYYAYNEGTLVSAGIKEVIAKDSSNNVVATMPIPSAVQSIEGYGWSAGSVYNYIDFARKKFVKRVGAVDLGSLTWIYKSGGIDATDYTSYFVTAFSLANNATQGVCGKYVKGSETPSGGIYPHEDKTFTFVTFHYVAGEINVFDSEYTDASAFKTAMSGVILYYELATPVETDISSILGAVGIACGNTLTFNYDTNYRLPVPVSMDLLDGTNGLMTPQDKAKLDVAYGAANTDPLSSIMPNQLPGSTFTISNTQYVVWISNSSARIAVSFPFVTKNTDYKVEITSMYVENIGNVSSSNISIPTAHKRNTGFRIDLSVNGTAGQTTTTYSFGAKITFV